MASCSISSPATTWARTMWSCFGPSTRCGPTSSQVSGRAVLSRSVVRLEDALADPDYDQRFPTAMSWRRMLGVPMLRQGEPLGVIVVGWAEAGPVPKAQEELLKQFADQGVIAIENVRLFDEVQARTRELTRSVSGAARRSARSAARSPRRSTCERCCASIIAHACPLADAGRRHDPRARTSAPPASTWRPARHGPGPDRSRAGASDPSR